MGFMSQSIRLRRGTLLAALVSSACLFLFITPEIAAAQVPEVGYMSASSVSTASATIEASINPESGETSYEIQLECQGPIASSQNCEPLTVGPQRLQGTLPAGFETKVVTDAVTGLQPGYAYKYRVIAANWAGREGFVGAGFQTCPPEGSCPPQPYRPGMSLWNIEAAEREAEEAPRLEAEREAKMREAAERAAREREIREAAERIGRKRACVVPQLKGDSLAKARHALHGAHCSLGKVTEPHGHHGPLVVVRQSVRSGSRLAPGSRVALKLGRENKR